MSHFKPPLVTFVISFARVTIEQKDPQEVTVQTEWLNFHGVNIKLPCSTATLHILDITPLERVMSHFKPHPILFCALST